jgi:uncharacterized protein YfkK (UPF0435 family)
METLTTEELQIKLAAIEHKLNILLMKGGNDEKLVSKKREILDILFKNYKTGNIS